MVCEPEGCRCSVTRCRQLAEEGRGLVVEDVLGRAEPKSDGFAVAEGAGNGCGSRPREFQAVQPEDDFRGGFDVISASGARIANAGDGGGKTLPGGTSVYGAGQPGVDVSAVGNVESLDGLGAFIEFIDLPLGHRYQDAPHAAGRSPIGRGQEELQSLHLGMARKTLALMVHPEDAKSKRSIDRRLAFVAIHA